MIRFLLIALGATLSINALAEDSYYLHELSRCEVSVFENKQLKVVDGKMFAKRVLEVRKLTKNPDHVVFKVNNQMYVTRESCVMSTDQSKITNNLQGNEYVKRPSELSAKEKFNLNKYFAEIDFGSVSVLDDGPVISDYNEVFPSSSSTNPTSWGKAEDSSYNPGKLISVGFGVRTSPTSFLAFKFRSFDGRKSDALDLVDVNTSLSQRGTWVYADEFKNFYIGYKFIFLDYSAWKPTFAAYIGGSYISSTMSDGNESHEMTSLGLSAMVEIGIEYHLNAHWGVGTNLGYEYLGKRSMKFSDESTGNDFKSNLDYSNQYLSVGLKYYFK